MLPDYIDYDNAVWAWHPERREHEDGLTLFRRVVNCQDACQFQLAVTADCRFNFYLDGVLLGRGPLRGCLEHYYYDEYSGKLNAGIHVFAAEVRVWRGAWRPSAAPWSEIHAGGGFFVAGYAGKERLELPGKWLTSIDCGIRSLAWAEAWSNRTFIPAPPMEEVKLEEHGYEWLMTDFHAGHNWISPISIGYPVFHGSYQLDPGTPWYLEPRPVAQMEQHAVPFAEILDAPKGFVIQDGKLVATCPAGQYRVLLDMGKNQTVMVYCSGIGGTGQCRLAYSEALFNENYERCQKMPGTIGQDGCADRLIFPTQDKNWEYRSFWYRTGRFCELDFKLETPIEHFELRIEFITYAFRQWRPFHAPNDPILEKIYAIGCHTLQCCSHEHFEDCPYYEQLQYAGDSRIEALASYAATGDDSLGRLCLRMFGYSQLSNGMTQSRFPSVFMQTIPVYSLIWCLMLYDHYCIFKDIALLKELLPKMLRTLESFESRCLQSGLIETPEGWHFVDWAKGWYGGCPARDELIPDTLHNLFYAEACRRMAELSEELHEDAAYLRLRWQRTVDAVNQRCFDKATGRYRDAENRDWFSLHSNVMAILAGAVPRKLRQKFLEEILADGNLTQPSLYFEFYVLSAMQRYSSPEALRQRLVHWEKMLAHGYTTFPETPEPTCRSLCHGWSVAPVWFLVNHKPLLLHPESD